MMYHKANLVIQIIHTSFIKFYKMLNTNNQGVAKIKVDNRSL